MQGQCILVPGWAPVGLQEDAFWASWVPAPPMGPSLHLAIPTSNYVDSLRFVPQPAVGLYESLLNTFLPLSVPRPHFLDLQVIAVTELCQSFQRPSVNAHRITCQYEQQVLGVPSLWVEPRNTHACQAGTAISTAPTNVQISIPCTLHPELEKEGCISL